MIKEIIDDEQKKKISRAILESLKEWFEVDSSREAYIEDSPGKLFFASFDGEKPNGFLYLKETGSSTVELAVMGVLKEFHRKGIGQELFEAAKERAKKLGYEFMQVKTVKMGVYSDYDRTNKFYLALGFKEFEVIPTYWDEANPCQIYVMAL